MEELSVDGLLWSSSTSTKCAALSPIHVSLRSASLISADGLCSIIYSSSNVSWTLYFAYPSRILSFALNYSLLLSTLSLSCYFLLCRLHILRKTIWGRHKGLHLFIHHLHRSLVKMRNEIRLHLLAQSLYFLMLCVQCLNQSVFYIPLPLLSLQSWVSLPFLLFSWSVY